MSYVNNYTEHICVIPILEENDFLYSDEKEDAALAGLRGLGKRFRLSCCKNAIAITACGRILSVLIVLDSASIGGLYNRELTVPATVLNRKNTMPRKVNAKVPVASPSPVARKTGKVGRPPRAPQPEVQALLIGDTADASNEDSEIQDGERKVEGKRLITLIKRTLIDKNLPDRYIADLMGVTTIYWNSMCNGHRKIKAVGKDKLERIGEFLGIPTVQVMILADYFEPTDFYAKRSLEDELEMVLQAMRTDPNWIALTPSKEEWVQLPVNTKILIALLFEREAGRSFMSKLQMEHPALAKKLGMEDSKAASA